jgi:HK97 family phage prohead protease
MKEFVISDESKNSYGIIVLTQGVSLEKFSKNPVMFYNHDMGKTGVIGRWENIRIDGDKLIATPVFDESDEFGKKIAKKVQDGFIRAASIGIEILMSNNNTITACELIEVSVCDIPSNGNALMLYHNRKPVKDIKEHIKLKLGLNINQNGMDEKDFKKIVELLGLGKDASFMDVIQEIVHLKGDDAVSLVSYGIENKFIKAYEKPMFLQMATVDREGFLTLVNERKKERITLIHDECKQLFNECVRDGRLDCDLSGKTLEMWKKAFEFDPDTAKDVLKNLWRRPRVIEHLNIQELKNPKDRQGWKLEDYRRKAPQELKRDPNLYNRLVKEANSENI